MLPGLAGILSGLAAAAGGGSSHQYWRLLFPSGSNDSSNNRMGIAEAEFRATAGGADQTTSGAENLTKATSSSFLNGSFQARQAFNNVTSGFDGWISANGSDNGSWLAYDFLAPVSVNEISVTAFDTSSSSMGPIDITVQSSDDGSSWTTEWTIAGPYTWTDGQTRVFTRP